MFDAPRIAVLIAFALMSVGAMTYFCHGPCAAGGTMRAAYVPDTGTQQVSLPDALRMMMREAAVSNATGTETDGIVPSSALSTGTHGMMMHIVAMPIQVIGAMRRAEPAPRAAAPRGPPPAV